MPRTPRLLRRPDPALPRPSVERRRLPRLRLTPAVLALLAVGLAGCGDPGPERPATSASDSASGAGTAGEPEAARFEEIGLPAAFALALAEAGVEGRALDGRGEAYGIAEVASDSGSFLVQWADLGAVAVEQVLGDSVGPGGPGLYHPTAPSPSFALLDPAGVVRRARDRGALAVMNGAFFETPGEPSSQIAFPLAIADPGGVAVGGRVVTGGSSPYGPGRPGAGARRWGRPLRALGLDAPTDPPTAGAGLGARVVDVDRQSGAPLGRPGFRDAVASYAPDAHPTRIATRFHVLGVTDGDRDGRTETLVVVTSDGRTRIGAAASLLTRLGAAPEDQVALDGGASVLVWTPRAGWLHRPSPIRGRPQPLPHYLVFTPRPDA